MSTLIVFSHLRWDAVFQRPQHLLSRLARTHRVVFIETPRPGDGTSRFERHAPMPGVLVLRACVPVQATGVDDDPWRAVSPLLARFMADEAIGDPLVWFCTPMALPLLAGLRARAVIYDCMTEVHADGATPTMREREAALLEAADLVLAGGPSLYRLQRDRHPNVHCLPSAIDAAHFAPARVTANCAEYLAAERLQGHILAPRLGWFGAIDERLDLGLVAALADADPHWHVVMVGSVEVEASRLPQRPNLHWLGHQPYARLPALVAAWDVCLLPLASNPHTRFINPTKTLEYLAADKPVVATAVPDVVGMYGDVVRIARDRDAFVAACRALLVETASQRAERLVASAASVSRFSWDETARTVQRLIDHVLERAEGRASHRGVARPAPDERRAAVPELSALPALPALPAPDTAFAVG